MNIKDMIGKAIIKAKLEEVQQVSMDELVGIIGGAVALYQMSDEEFIETQAVKKVPEDIATGIANIGRKTFMANEIIEMSKKLMEKRILEERFDGDVDKMLEEFMGFSAGMDISREVEDILNQEKDGENE